MSKIAPLASRQTSKKNINFISNDGHKDITYDFVSYAYLTFDFQILTTQYR